MIREFAQLDDELKYRCKPCSAMTDDEIQATSKLFSENYGIWSPLHPDTNKIGQRIRYPVKKVKEDYVNKPDRYVAMVYHNGELIGHAFYLRRKINTLGFVTWILQLVVNEKYRGHHIGTKLMHSIWGLSDSFACGLYTSNPMTICALENATMRPVKVSLINTHIDKLRRVAYDIMPESNWLDAYSKGIVDTNFRTDHSDLQEKIRRYEIKRPFPLNRKLPEGCEWLAFTFRRQEPSLMTPEQLATYFSFSESILVDAYSRMDMKNQKWSAHAEQEVEFIEKHLKASCDILDLGCGYGRHACLLAEKGHNVIGVDFSCVTPTAPERLKESNPVFIKADARSFKSDKKFDAILCMYDVIGSFPSNEDNLRILNNAYEHLKPNGKIFLSVMSLELTKRNCKKHKNIVVSEVEGYRTIMKLKGSDTMQQTGNIFDGKLIVLNEANGVAYRKEQFFSENYLPTEYLIRDRRYNFEGIALLLKKAGFAIDKKIGFSSGKLDETKPIDENKAKELFVVAHKVNPLRAFIQRICTEIDE